MQYLLAEAGIIPGTAPALRATADVAMAASVSRPWYRKPLCSLGIHRGPWGFVADGECTQTRTCERCETTHTRTKHRHQWHYRRAGSCKQDRACIRCGLVRSERTKHEEWGKSYEVSSERDGHRCERCGEVETWSTASDD